MPDHMLVIDDDAAVLQSCRRVFEEEGYEVTTTDCPEEGLKLVGEGGYEVILCDWKMPGFNGLDVVGEIDRRTKHHRAATGDDSDTVLETERDRFVRDATLAKRAVHPHPSDAKSDALTNQFGSDPERRCDHDRIDPARNGSKGGIADDAFDPVGLRVDRKRLVTAITKFAEDEVGSLVLGS